MWKEKRQGHRGRSPCLGRVCLGSAVREEDREEDDTLDQSCEDDRELEDVRGSTGITTGGLSSLGAEKADTDGGTDGSESNVEVTVDGDLCEHLD